MTNATPNPKVLAIGLVLLTLQFFLSGLNKVVYTRSCYDARQLAQFFGERCWINVPAMLVAGVWQLIASGIVIGASISLLGGSTDHSASPRWRYATKMALLSLVLFTVLVTLMFKTRPREWASKPALYYGFISNVAVTGGLLATSTAF